MIKPVLQDDEFCQDVEKARRDQENLHLWWLGQSGFLIHWMDHFLLMDPYLSDSLTHKYAGTDKPHVRMSERVVGPERLDFVNVVTSSHIHTDHLDPDTLIPVLRANRRLELVIPEANREFVVDRLRVMAEYPRGLDAGQWVQVGGFKIHAVPAAHNEVEKDEWGRHKFLGYVVEAGRWILYHAGDTVRYRGMEAWLQRWPIDLALLPINGHRAERRVAGNLDGPEAARLAKDIGARLIIPCHYDMFEFNTVSPEAFILAAKKLGQPYCVLACGERWTSSALK